MSVEEALAILKNEVVEVSRDGNRTLKVKCSNSHYANGLIGTYGVIFGHNDVDDVGFHFLNTDKYAYPRFRTTELREEALQLTQDLMDGKEVTVTTGSVSTGGTGTSTSTTTTTTTTTVAGDTKPEKKTDWITYLIIGIAAIVIILLLFDRKKK